MFKSKKEFAQAMLKGKKFKISEGICYYEGSITQPFRFCDQNGNDEILKGCWDDYETAEEVKEWYDEIPSHGVLCQVWGASYTKNNKRIRLVTRYANINCPFITDDGSWSNAEPINLGDYT